MSSPLRPEPWASFGRELEDEDSAAVALFVQCCRQSPALRHWLFHEFARAASVRNGFAKVLRADASAATPLPSSVAELVGENHALREEQQRLKPQRFRVVASNQQVHEQNTCRAEARTSWDFARFDRPRA